MMHTIRFLNVCTSGMDENHHGMESNSHGYRREKSLLLRKNVAYWNVPSSDRKSLWNMFRIWASTALSVDTLSGLRLRLYLRKWNSDT